MDVATPSLWQFKACSYSACLPIWREDHVLITYIIVIRDRNWNNGYPRAVSPTQLMILAPHSQYSTSNRKFVISQYVSTSRHDNYIILHTRTYFLFRNNFVQSVSQAVSRSTDAVKMCPIFVGEFLSQSQRNRSLPGNNENYDMTKK